MRLYKTRSQASAACDAGHVRINGHPCKPARAVRPGDILNALAGDVHRTVKVLDVLENRIGPKLVSCYLEDQTPAAEYEKQKLNQMSPVGRREKGSGRPTKKEHRILGSFFGIEE